MSEDALDKEVKRIVKSYYKGKISVEKAREKLDTLFHKDKRHKETLEKAFSSFKRRKKDSKVETLEQFFGSG